MKAVVPTYNERDNVQTLLDGVRNAWKKIPHHSLDIVVVDDLSPDKTADVVVEYHRKQKNVYLVSGKKEGLGKALLRGMRYAIDKLDADIIVQMDADLSHDPGSLPLFLRAIDDGGDFVVGSRYIDGGSIPNNWAIHRKIYSMAGNAIVRFGLGYLRVHDWTGGYRAYKREFASRIMSEMSLYEGYVFQIAFLDKAIHAGARVVEVPIQFSDRRFGHSKIAPYQYIRDILWYVGKERIQVLLAGSFGKFLVVGSIGFIINTVVLEGLVLFHFHPTIGSIVGAELAIISNFVLNNAWTFRSQAIDRGLRLRKFIQFNATSLGAVVIQAVSIAIGTAFFGVNAYRVFYIVGVAIGLVWNYTMYSRVIWKQ